MTIVLSAAMYTGMHIFFQTHVFIFWARCQEVELLGHVGTLILPFFFFFSGISIVFPMEAKSDNSPINSEYSFFFTTFPQTLIVSSLFDVYNPHWHRIISYFYFTFHFPDYK